MEPKFAIKNGKLLEKDRACIPVHNKALFFDFAVYSNIKVVNSTMFLPNMEIEKLFESARAVGIAHNFTSENILDWAKLLIKKNKIKDAIIRILLIGQEEGSEPMLFLFPVGLTFYPNKLYKKGVKLITYKGERFMPTSKTKNMLLNYVAYNEAKKQSAIDALLVDSQNNILEGTRSSFFVVKDDVLIAPPSKKVLEGVTRKIIFGIAPKLMKVKEEDIPLGKIKEYDEHFITGTTLNIMPVRQMDNDVLRDECGKKVMELQKLFKEFCKNESRD